MEKGRVVGLVGGIYEVMLDDGVLITCKARGKLRCVKVDKNSNFIVKKNKNATKQDTQIVKTSPKVGDFVVVDMQEDTIVIHDILPRRNEMIRPDIANVDQILLVCSAKRPDFSSLLLDLFLVNIEYKKIEPIIVITKIDLLTKEELDELIETMAYYKNMGYQVIFCNSKLHENVDLIIPLLKDKITVLTGQTGAGKSTLINALIPGFNLKTDDISLALGRGKHTTREVKLYSYYGGFIGDTPGFSKIDLESISKDDLKTYFRDFEAYTCRFKDCLHLENSKDCMVNEAYKEKKILASRYENYLHMLEQIEKKGRK